MALTETTRQSAQNHINMWRQIALSTAPASKEGAIGAIVQAYSIVGLKPPSRWLWLQSPMAGAIAAAHAVTAFQPVTGRVWRKPQEFMTKKLWQKAEESHATQYWKDVQEYINRSSLLGVRNNVLLPIAKQIVDQHEQKTKQARASIFTRTQSGSNLSTDVWNKALMELRSNLNQKELKALNSSVTFETISDQVKACSFGNMDAMFLAFLDYGNLYGFKLNDINGITTAAKHCGWWWAFDDLCIVTDRPKTIALTNRLQLHRPQAHAVEYGDNWGIYAIEGKVVTREVADAAVGISAETPGQSAADALHRLAYGRLPKTD